jgi:hypothetical protein
LGDEIALYFHFKLKTFNQCCKNIRLLNMQPMSGVGYGAESRLWE